MYALVNKRIKQARFSEIYNEKLNKFLDNDAFSVMSLILLNNLW